ncbi:MAG: tRNA (N(6)-L-threonylcarbamoyladenosine(37)-C(2))-methylthiotransferase MtaB [Chitinophagales bacterium]
MKTIQQKVAFYTLGCKLNYSETSALGRLMNENGFKTVPFHQAANVYVINTCSVTENADKKCRKVIRQALKHSPNAYIVIVGCYAQLKPKEISEIEGVDLVLGAAEKFNLAAHLTDLTKTKKGRFIASDVANANMFIDAFSVGERTRSFLKVQDGCDYKCAFCTIPLARGKSRSDELENVVRNAQEIAKMGVKEIVLTGVNIGDYGKRMAGNGEKKNFLDLIRALDEVPVERFRISSIEPNLLTDEIIAFVAQSKRFMPHFHIPLQSGNNKMLRLMRRRYQRELYVERVETIKRLMPHCCIGVDVIVGFPSESHEDFLETYHFLNELDVSYFHVFTYSERNNTQALDIKPIVPIHKRRERNQMLRILSEKKRRHFYEQHLKTTRSVLFETENDGNTMFGFTDNYIKIETTYDPLLANEIRTMKLLGINPNNFVAVEELEQATMLH